jgi:hypothetical protein
LSPKEEIMKLIVPYLAVGVYLGAVAVAKAQDYCEDNCESTESYGRDDCYCDEQCEDLTDCCPSYEEFCVTRRSSGDGTCRGCPQGPQPSTSGRASCYCDDACVAASDCCDSYEQFCASGYGSMNSVIRQDFCEHLDLSKASYCDVDLKVGTFFPMTIRETGDEEDGNNGYMKRWAQSTFDATCLNDPEVTGEATTCYGADYSYTYWADQEENGEGTVYWRFGISGLSVYQNFCFRDDDCEECDDVWLRTAFGVAWEGTADFDVFWGDFEYDYGYHVNNGKYMAAIPGVCNVVFNQECGEEQKEGNPDDDCVPDSDERSTRLTHLAGVFGSGDAVYDISVEDLLIFDNGYTNGLHPAKVGWSITSQSAVYSPHMAPTAVDEERTWDFSEDQYFLRENTLLWKLTDLEYMHHKMAAEATAMKWQGWMTQNWENEDAFSWDETVQTTGYLE